MNSTIQIGFDTDIGGSNQNQDDMFVWNDSENDICVIAVFDGHGREFGKNVAYNAKTTMLQYLETNGKDILIDAPAFLIECHIRAHNNIRIELLSELTKQNYELREDPSGFIMKRKLPCQGWSVVPGGTTCSIIAFVNNKLYIANVGDSDGILCSKHKILQPSLINYITDAATSEKLLEDPLPCDDLSTTILLTCNHSPESIKEFDRFCKFKPHDSSNSKILTVYDNSEKEKISCIPIFNISETGVPTVSNNGKYYKNVRNEWGSLVTTPSDARFSESLAFTRSLGDLYLHTYGVSNLPEIQSIDLTTVFERQSSEEDANTICVVLATDGVWDNWNYNAVTQFVMDPSCLKAIVNKPSDGAQLVATSLIRRNNIFAKRNFGNQSDNATCIVMYITKDK